MTCGIQKLHTLKKHSIMKLSTISYSFSAAALIFIIAVTACSRDERLAGTWQGNPEKLIAVNGASDASTTVTLDFVPDQGRKGTGTLNISAVINAEQAVKGAVDAVVEPYEASVAATASITGRYAVEDRDDDDLVVSFDPTSMDVNIDPSGVTFSENAITGMQQPTLDSLSRATSQHWRTALTPAIREVFNRYRRIEDIKVHHDNIMSCEVADRDYTFRRVGVPD